MCLAIVGIITVAFYRMSDTIDILSIWTDAKKILSPFIYGLGIAYILNSSLKFLEKRILSKIKYLENKKNLKRGISITGTYLILFGFLCWIISYLIPEIQESVIDVSNYFKTFDINSFDEMIKEYIPLDQEFLGNITFYLNDILTNILANIPEYTRRILSSTINIASILLNVILGIVISIYMLFDKEDTSEHSKKVLYTLLPKNKAKNLINFFKEANDTFEKFFVGKIIDSSIIGAIFFVGATMLKAPFTILLSIIIGITNMIPFFGPFLGAVPVIFITLMFDIANPLKAVWIGIFILGLQQFDGNILGPKILGDSIGIKPIGIIFSIILGGALLGPAGMFFGVPIFAVLVSVFNKYIDRKYNEKYNNKLNEL